jgi:manganese/zinc/iron transport system permease protein
MMAALAVVTIVGLPICGVILMAALIILPGAAARFWTDRLGQMLTIAAGAGAAAGVIGTLAASPLPERWLGFEPLGARGLPPGPLIVLAATAFFLVSLFFAPRQGLVARTWAELRLRTRIAREHLLRALYELSEDQLPERPFVDESQLVAHRAWSKWLVDWWLIRAERNGLVERRLTEIRLTPRGLSAAAEVTKTHRLWELFLVESAGVASDHVDRDADDVEHMLPKALVNDLERRLAEAGQLPVVPKTVPESPHELTG